MSSGRCARTWPRCATSGYSAPFPTTRKNRELLTWQVLLQVVNHGTDHRAQILRALSDLGVETRSQDYVFFAYRHPVD